MHNACRSGIYLGWEMVSCLAREVSSFQGSGIEHCISQVKVFINPRRAYAARVVLCVCVCLCVQAAHLRLTQLSDKLDILTDLVSCWLQI